MAPDRLADLAARAERFVGTKSGGMDQAVCLLAQAGHALRIDFDPLRARAGADAARRGAGGLPQPGRRGEIRRGARRLQRAGRRVSPRLPSPSSRWSAARLRRIWEICAGVLPNARSADWLERLGQRVPPGRRARLRRVRHVLGEAERVDAAEAALAAGRWSELGALMNASHASCRDDYEVSCPELEALVAAARESGALGARLTGAGFGGCTINLVAAADAAGFVERIERDLLPRSSRRRRTRALFRRHAQCRGVGQPTLKPARSRGARNAHVRSGARQGRPWRDLGVPGGSMVRWNPWTPTSCANASRPSSPVRRAASSWSTTCASCPAARRERSGRSTRRSGASTCR